MGDSSYCRIRHNTLYRNVFYSHVERSAVLSRHCRHYRASVRSYFDLVGAFILIVDFSGKLGVAPVRRLDGYSEISVVY